MTQLKFIDENDYLLAEHFQENENGSISVKHGSWFGIIPEGYTRTTEVQDGTETVVVGQDENGEDVTEEQPKMVNVEIDVWGKLKELESAGTITIEAYVKSYEEFRQELKQQRDNALANMLHDFGDGRIVQVRKDDLTEFQTEIANGETRNWIAADNTIVSLTVSEMTEALNSGISQGRAIYDEYMAALDALNNQT